MRLGPFLQTPMAHRQHLRNQDTGMRSRHPAYGADHAGSSAFDQTLVCALHQPSWTLLVYYLMHVLRHLDPSPSWPTMFATCRHVPSLIRGSPACVVSALIVCFNQ
jgi:hypothetical protein